MKQQTIYANLHEPILLTCEQCGRSKKIPLEAVKDHTQPLKVQCPCGAAFRVGIIVRKFYRKKTQLSGTYVKRGVMTNNVMERGRMVVEDLSRTGVGLRTLCKHTLAPDDIIALTFTLDDQQRTTIQRTAQVKRVHDLFIGAAWVDQDAYTSENRMLGFYLMPR
ncbi:MAG: PilZ domain-containing protein [Candidatus Tectimicrobiota bacterium]